MPVGQDIAALKKEVVDLISDATLTDDQLKAIVLSFQDCKFRPLLKLGMSKGDADDAIDGAMDVLLTCLRSKLVR